MEAATSLDIPVNNSDVALWLSSSGAGKYIHYRWMISFFTVRIGMRYAVSDVNQDEHSLSFANDNTKVIFFEAVRSDRYFVAVCPSFLVF